MSRKGGAASAGTKSMNSRGTRKTGTMSRKSKADEDFESMEIEEIEALIITAEQIMKEKNV